MALPAVPVGWTPMEEVIEEVPNPNFGTAYGQNYFVRVTYRTTWPERNLTVSDGSMDACASQAFALAQSQTQRASEGQPV
jgi:hypothetical protein